MPKYVTLLALHPPYFVDWKFVSNSDLFWNFFVFKNSKK